MATKESSIEEIIEELWKNPSEKNWEAFAKKLPKSGLKYYRVVYPKGKIKRVEDLKKAYAELYDAKEKFVAKVPVYKKNGKMAGATYYLKGLSSINYIGK